MLWMVMRTFNNIGSTTGAVPQLTTKVVDKDSQDMNASKIQVNTSAKGSLRPVAGKTTRRTRSITLIWPEVQR
ncbi:hypothetical protein MtrunA17_Chr7g0225761 [Medicago truncatula]|uniref:Uncharacterized protein n=1 Tax=Medicago truncatula TaxID=3880 RepID=A0A396GWZ8_MEDTR|nr:hypothetical protein MtrunA17_Chr7g0225761 [Medicago truncatula]